MRSSLVLAMRAIGTGLMAAAEVISGGVTFEEVTTLDDHAPDEPLPAGTPPAVVTDEALSMIQREPLPDAPVDEREPTVLIRRS